MLDVLGEEPRPPRPGRGRTGLALLAVAAGAAAWWSTGTPAPAPAPEPAAGASPVAPVAVALDSPPLLRRLPDGRSLLGLALRAHDGPHRVVEARWVPEDPAWAGEALVGERLDERSNPVSVLLERDCGTAGTPSGRLELDLVTAADESLALTLRPAHLGLPCVPWEADPLPADDAVVVRGTVLSGPRDGEAPVLLLVQGPAGRRLERLVGTATGWRPERLPLPLGPEPVVLRAAARLLRCDTDGVELPSPVVPGTSTSEISLERVEELEALREQTCG